MSDVRGSGAKRVFAFVDTNVLLHYRFFRDVNWAKELSADEAILVFAPVVLEELDKWKWAGIRRARTRAQKVLKALTDLQLSVTPVAMREDAKIMALDEEPPDALFRRYRLQPRINDDRILAAALEFPVAMHRGGEVLIVTADMGLRLKASTRKINVTVPDDKLRLNDEPDDTERALRAARRELATLQAVAPKAKLTIGGGNVFEYRVRRFGEFSEGRMAHLLEDWRSKHPYIDVTPDSLLVRRPMLLSEKDATAHNAKIDRAYGEYESFLRQWPKEVNALARCIECRFVLENDGTVPAEHVDLRIAAQANGRWLVELPGIPLPPTVPPPRSPFDVGNMWQSSSFDPSELRFPHDPIDGPNVSKDDPQSVRYTVRRVQHHVPCVLPVVFFQLDSEKDVAPFTMPYRLVASNLREPRRDELHVKLSVSTVEDPPTAEELLGTNGVEGEEVRPRR